MVKKCVYCNVQLEDDSVIDFCQKCGVGVWGPKMFEAIVQNMENARDVGDLYQGSVSESQNAKPTVPKKVPSLLEDAKKAIEQNASKESEVQPQISQESPLPLSSSPQESPKENSTFLQEFAEPQNTATTLVDEISQATTQEEPQISSQ